MEGIDEFLERIEGMIVGKYAEVIIASFGTGLEGEEAPNILTNSNFAFNSTNEIIFLDF
jgi:hypothetical protein